MLLVQMGCRQNYQKFWEIIKEDLKNMFDDFHNSVLPIERFNYGLITLLPKKENAEEIRSYRPICLLNVSYKILTEVLTHRLSLVSKKVISENQTGFIKSRFI